MTQNERPANSGYEYPIIDSAEKFAARLAEVRTAQRAYAAYSQEQVDKIFKAAAIAANKARIPLAKLAVEETGMGIVEDKVIKNNYASEYIYNAYKNTKTCGVVEEDKKDSRTAGRDRGGHSDHQPHLDGDI